MEKMRDPQLPPQLESAPSIVWRMALQVRRASWIG